MIIILPKFSSKGKLGAAELKEMDGVYATGGRLFLHSETSDQLNQKRSLSLSPCLSCVEPTSSSHLAWQS
jgi:hypothetical protein